MGEFGVVGPDGSAVRDEQSWILFSESVVERLIEVAGDRSAIFTFEVDVFSRRQLQLPKESVVDVGDLRVLAVDDGKELVRALGRGDLGNGDAIRTIADGVAVDGDA